MSEEIHHNCGVYVGHTLEDTYSAMKSALQHRGREAWGIGGIGETIDVVKGEGPVNRFDVVDLHKVFPGHKYHTFIGHVRYATRGGKNRILKDAHPQTIGGRIVDRGSHMLILDCEAAGVHNGQVEEKYFSGVNRSALMTGCDTEPLLHLFRDKGEFEILKEIPGAYTLAFADKRRKDVVVLRDRHGIKPGVLGLQNGKYGIASEDIAFRKNGGDFVEDLDLGSVYYLSPDGGYDKKLVVSPQERLCFFEFNYIADRDSIINGLSVRRVREALGEAVAEEFHPDDIDMVTFLPRCPEAAARSYAKKLNLLFAYVFYKERGERSFMGSTSDERMQSIDSNLNLLPVIYDLKGNIIDLKGKRVLSKDDSVVRGNNTRRERKLLYDEGEVEKAYHVSYTPPIGIIGDDGVPRGCMFGVDMPPNPPRGDEFVARTKRPDDLPPDIPFTERNRTMDEISEEIGMETHYLSVEGMLRAYEKLGIPRENLCTYCIGGKHPFE